MKKLFFVLVLLLSGLNTNSWGFKAHQLINRAALYTLPPELFSFYKPHIDWICKHATDPDNRRYTVKGEAEKHFIDLEEYGEPDSIPIYWKDAVNKYTEDSLRQWGIVPWHIQHEYYSLVGAFSRKDLQAILRHSSDLGHYVADAHVPLHTTHNHNGQFTGQRGIHAFWESRLPELFYSDLNFWGGKARYIQRLAPVIWERIFESHAAVDTVLSLDRKIRAVLSESDRVQWEERKGKLISTPSYQYAALYHNLLNGLVECKLRKSIELIGSMWFSAWVDAGQPDLQDMKPFKEEKTSSSQSDTLRVKHCEE